VHSSSDTLTPRESLLVERREAAVQRLYDRTPLIYRKTIDVDPHIPDWIAGWGGNSLFLTGPIGVGKTHTAWQTCRLWLQAQYGPGQPWAGTPLIRIWRSTALFDALRPNAPDGEGRTLTRELQEADLLFIDDLAAARANEWTQERLFEIFDERYINRRPVIITSDVLPADLAPITGPRVASRLSEMCKGSVLLLEGNDRRKGIAA
jgi:DNA replication protein DnaC